MPAMTNPNDALVSFQEYLPMLMPRIQRGTLHREVFVYADEVGDTTRFTYATLRSNVVVAVAIVVMDTPEDGWMYFDLGYAVAEPFRGGGHAKSLVNAALEEMAHGFRRTPIKGFIVNAVFGIDNLVSQHVAAATLGVDPAAITDVESGLPALHYRAEFPTN